MIVAAPAAEPDLTAEHLRALAALRRTELRMVAALEGQIAAEGDDE